MLRKIIIAASLAIPLTGCTSFRSTIMSRMPNDQFRKNSDQCTRGIPVTLKIPTHVDVKVVEEYFIVQGNTETKIPELPKPIRTVHMDTIYTPKVMTVDLVRPAAGTLDILGAQDTDGITLDPEQYFNSIQAAIDDQTIEDITASIPNISKILGRTPTEAAQVAAGGEDTQTSQLQSYKAVIAWRRFDINEPNWEFEAQAFAEQHINCQISPCAANANCPVETFVR